MVDTTILNKINLIYSFIKDNSFIFMILLLVLIILIDLIYGNNSKSTKRLYAITIILILLYGTFEYYKPLLNIVDTYITNLVKLAYFPSLIEYFTMILITIFFQIYSIKKYEGVQKNINIWVAIFIEFLFITNVIAMKDITVDLSTITKIYEQDLLLSIFELSSMVFILWIVTNIIINIIKLFLTPRIEIPKLNNEYE